MWTIVTAAVALSLVASARPADRTVIEDCAYPSSAAVLAAWAPQYGSAGASLADEKTPDGKPALLFPCDMAKVTERSVWDRAVTLDLGRSSRIAFWIKLMGDPAAIGGCTLYFNAGDGWYGAGFDLPDDGWRRIVLDRGSFTPEGKPDGWSKLRAIRFSFWKGLDRRATVLVGGIEALTSSVAIVRNARAGQETASWAGRMATMMAAAGIDAGVIDDADVEAGALEGKRVAVYPYNPDQSPGECAALERFVGGGGRILACFGMSPRLAELLGMRDAGYLRPDRPGMFASMRFREGGPLGLPRVARQGSWNITRARPAGHGARVIADWYDSDGKPTGEPAVLLSDRGAYITHVVLDDDPAAKTRMLRALLGHFDATIWPEAAAGALKAAANVSGRWQGLDETAKGIRLLAVGSGRAQQVEGLLKSARLAHERAHAAVAAGRSHAALEPAEAARQFLVEAFATAQPARSGEFRAVWCHSAYGVDGMTWDQAIAALKRSGFTAVVPNMLWGGSADYASDLLPVTERSRKEGDQIQACLAACRKHGLQVHVWKVNWNLATAPSQFVARMRQEGRLQRTSDGAEELWLCPSHPANFELERDTMLEVARKYAVDGIHFDYIRYPDSSKCYCEGCRGRFEAESGKTVARWPSDVLRGGPLYADYQEFRRANITRLVRAVAEEGRRVRPGIKISAAVFPNWPSCREEIGQDWGAWVKSGYLDFVCPMDYTSSNREFRTRVQVQREAVGGRIPLYPGIGASAPGLDPAQVIEQVQIAREERAQGFIIFNYDARVATEHLPMLSKGATRK